MKKHCITLFVTMLSIGCFAQSDWPLFPLSQQSWWRDNKDSLSVFYADSIESLGNQAYAYHFGNKYVQGGLDESCMFNLATDPEPPSGLEVSFPEWYLSPLYEKNGLWRFEQGGEVIFRSNCQPGDSWAFSTESSGGAYQLVSMECIGNDTVEVLGVTTAAKYIRLTLPDNPAHPLNGFVFTLTERFGFTRYISLLRLYKGQESPVYTLAGTKKGNDAYGFAPSFDRIMGNYKAGDLYKWHYRSSTQGPFSSSTDMWMLDSITKLEYLSDRLNVYSRRKTLERRSISQNGQTTVDSLYSINPNAVEAYFYVELEALFSAVPGWITPYGDFGSVLKSFGGFDSLGNGTIGADLTFAKYDPSNCSLSYIFDQSIVDTYHEKLGLICRKTTSGGAGWTDGMLKLIGAKQGSDIWGDISELQTVPTRDIPGVIPSLNLYPNPCKGAFEVLLPFQQTGRLSVSDAQGRVLLVQDLTDVAQQIDVSHLHTGVYMVQVESGQKRAQSVLVIR